MAHFNKIFSGSRNGVSPRGFLLFGLILGLLLVGMNGFAGGGSEASGTAQPAEAVDQAGETNGQAATAAESVARTPGDQILVDPQWLQEHLGEVTIIDAARGQDAFGEGHIPGAALLAREVVWDTVNGISGMLPDPEIAALDLADAGVFNDRPVVVYDGGNGLWASRVFWALEYLGHSQVHLLDGGIAAWQQAGFELETEVTVPARGDFIANPQPELIADSAYLVEQLDNEAFTVLDTRSPQEYSGEDVRAERGGHIPGSVNIEWTQNLGEGRSFLPTSQLAELYDSVVDPETGEAVTLCQTGVRGAHSYVALRILGYDRVRVYDGSWAEWGNREDLPVEL